MDSLPPELWRLVEKASLVPVLLVCLWVLWRAYTAKDAQMEKLIERLSELKQLRERIDELVADSRRRSG